MENDLYNSVIYSEEPMANSWITFVTILKEYGITKWAHGGTIGEEEPFLRDRYVYIIEEGELDGFWGEETYEVSLEEEMFIRDFKNHTHVNIDELKNSKEMDTFFFESIVKKVLNRL